MRCNILCVIDMSNHGKDEHSEVTTILIYSNFWKKKSTNLSCEHIYFKTLSEMNFIFVIKIMIKLSLSHVLNMTYKLLFNINGLYFEQHTISKYFGKCFRHFFCIKFDCSHPPPPSNKYSWKCRSYPFVYKMTRWWPQLYTFCLLFGN